MVKISRRKVRKFFYNLPQFFVSVFSKSSLLTEEKRASSSAYLLPVEAQKEQVKIINKNVTINKTVTLRAFTSRRLKFTKYFLKKLTRFTRSFRIVNWKKTLRPVLAGVLVIVLLVQIFSPNGNSVLGATYTFTQTSWAGGANVAATAVHPTNDSSYTVYNSKDANLQVVNSGLDLQLTTSTFYTTSTSDTDFNGTAAGGPAASFSQTNVSGSGDSAAIQLGLSSPNGPMMVSGDNGYSMGLKSDGTVWGWGANSSGQMGINSAVAGTSTPRQVHGPNDVGYLTGIISITSNASHTFALKSDGTVWGWGSNSLPNGAKGALGNLPLGSSIYSLIPVQVSNLTGIIAVSAGSQNALALKSDGTVWAWGLNYNGEIGDNTVTLRNSPVQVLDSSGTGFLTGIIAISAGLASSYALKSDGTVWAWGSQGVGQLGIGIETVVNGCDDGDGPYTCDILADHHLPVQVKGLNGTGYLTGIGAIFSGNGSVFAIKSDGTVWAWGSNANGQLGMNDVIAKTTPNQVLGTGGVGYLSNVSTSSINSIHSIALKSDDTVWAWGNNFYGQLGINNTTQYNTPIQVLGVGGTGNLTGVSSISAGLSHSLASKPDGTVWAWGRNESFQLGDKTATNRSTPVQVMQTDSTPFSLLGAQVFYLSGTYTSGAIDLTTGVDNWQNLTWAETGGQTITMKVRSADNAAMTGATAFASCTNIANGGSITAGGCVSPHHRYVQYQASLSTSDNSVTPSLDSVTFGYYKYNTSAILTSVPFDSGDSSSVMGSVNWDEDPTLPAGTTVSTSVRTANNISMTGASAWYDYSSATAGCTKSTVSVSCPNSVLASALKSGGDDRYFQYKVALTSNGTYTPTYSESRIQFVINAAPVVRVLSASQNNDGTVTISYEVSDSDTSDVNGVNPNQFQPSFQYCASGNQSSCSSIVAFPASDLTLKADSSVTSTYTATWTPNNDNVTANIYDGTALIKVIADDNEGANRQGSEFSAPFVLDTKPPASPLLKVDASVTPAVVTVGATDDLAIQYRVSQNSSFSGAVWQNLTTATTSATLSLTGNPATVYAEFMDAVSNTSTVYQRTTPETPTSTMIQDVSNIISTPAEYQLFTAWKIVASPNNDFAFYRIYRSTDGINWSLLNSLNDRSVNYYMDRLLTQNQQYYYRIVTEDTNGNSSFPSEIVGGKPNASVDPGEGGGGLTPAPTISGITTSTVTASSIDITWDTDILSNSTIQYSANVGQFSNNVTVASMVINSSTPIGGHRVIIAGLVPNTTYYFQVRSANVDNVATTDNNGGSGYVFSTTPGPTITAGPTPVALNTSATVVWQTNMSANSTIFYSTSADCSLPDNVSDLSNYTTTHSLTISNLTPGTAYCFYVRSIDNTGNVVYDQRVFNGVALYYSFNTTNDITAPVINNAIAAVNTTTAAISWSTNELANSQINYGLTVGYGSSTTLDATLTTQHSVNL
ncbi:MAG: fibronectin type III domain-containing protein, partial [Candidatus Magasanikbacteria bacterium]